MTHKILVTYASRTGSTAGVAEAIGDTLCKNNIQVDVCAMQDVADITGYEALVIGSAVQAQQWLPEAMQFIESRRIELAQKPVAMFTLCMTLALKDGEKYRPNILNWIAPVRSRLHPVSEALFAGKLDIGKIPSLTDRLKFRLSILLGVWAEGDHRDWNAIHEWASELPLHLLQLETNTATNL